MQSFEEPPAADHNSGQLSQEIKANELDHRSTIIPICFHKCTRVDVATCEILIEHAVGFSLLELGVDFDSRNTPELGVETSPVDWTLLESNAVDWGLVAHFDDLILHGGCVAWHIAGINLVFEISFEIIIFGVYY